MIQFTDGTTAQLQGKHIVWDGGGAALADVTITPLKSAFPADLSAITPPVMFASITIDGEARDAVMSLADYQQIAIASTSLAAPSAAQQRSVNLIAPVVARLGNAARRVCGACAKR